MRASMRKFGHATALLLPIFMLAACDQYRTKSSTIEDTLSSVSFDPPPQPAAGPNVVRVEQNTGANGRQGETYFGGVTSTGSSATRASRTTDGVQVNFDGADVREVVQFVLRDILGKTYTIDPQISGEVILSSSAPLDEAELLTVLETILRMHGATLVASGDSFAVQALGDSQGGTDIAALGGGAPPRVAPGLGFSVVPLRFMTADAAAQFVQPLVSRPEQIRVDSTRNLLLFSGSNAERQTVVDTLYEVDIDWMAGRSVGIFPLSMSSPEAIIGELEAVFGPLDPNGLRSETIRFLPMARLNAVLVIANRPEQVSSAKTWVTRLDRGNSAGTQFYVYQLQHVPATDMADLLTESISGIEPAATDIDNPSADEPLNDPFATVPDDATPAGFSGTTEVGRAASSALLEQVKIVPNELNNTLLVRAAPQAYEMIEATLRRLDTAPLQVLIEATIAEVTLTDQLRFGVQYYLNAGSVATGFNTSTITNSGVATGSLLEPLARLPGFNFVFTPGSSNITIDALSRITDVKVLSSPSLVVQDNSEAILNVGDEVPIVTRSATNVEDTDSVVVNNIEYRDTGVILEVKPRISSNSMVAMEISQEVSRVATETSVQSDSLTPTIQQRKITSTINILSGQTVVLGGLIQESETDAQDKIPLLGDLPLLGPLFQNNNTQNTRTELIVIITPRIMRNAEDARDISSELRARMRSVSPLPPSSQNVTEPPSTGQPQAIPEPAQPLTEPVLPTLPPPTTSQLLEGPPATTDIRLANANPEDELAIRSETSPLRHAQPVRALAQADARPVLPLPIDTEPMIPAMNPKRAARVALPLPGDLIEREQAVPVPSERPVPGFRLQPQTWLIETFPTAG